MNTNSPVIIAPEVPGSGTIRVPVLRLFDGDGFLTTIRTSDLTGNPRDQTEFEAAVRFGFIDAPEVEQPGGREARDFLASLIADRWVDLMILMKMDTGRPVDDYHRIVCVPYLTEEYNSGEFKTLSGGLHSVMTFGEPFIVTRNIELEMVLNGWAWVLDRYGPDERYLEALEDARRHKRGIWAKEGNIHPWEFKRQKHRKKRARVVPDLFDRHTCPVEHCDGHLVQRTGRFGPFIGCSNFPECRYSCSATA